MRFLSVVILLAAAFLGVASVNADDSAASAVVNGSFEKAGDMDGAEGWTRGDPALVNFVTEEGARFCRIDLTEKKAAIIEQTLAVDPKWKSVDFAVRMRAVNVMKGDQDWMTGQYQFLFVDKDDKVIGGWNRLKIDGDTGGWKPFEKKALAVPAGAVKLKVAIGVWGASGTFDFDDVKAVAGGGVNSPAAAAAAPVTAGRLIRTSTAAAPVGPVTRLDYYVSPDGKDTDDGRTLQTAFRTIQHAAEVMNAGDTCRIRTGVYRETIRPARSGQNGAPITFEPYQGEKVIISGTDPVTGWSAGPDGSYSAAMPADFFVSKMNQADQIFVDGAMVHQARWPDIGSDISNPAKATITKFVSKSRSGNWTTAVFEDDKIPAGTNFKGAEIYVQPNSEGWGWTFCGTVIDHQGKTITLKSVNDSNADGKNHYAVGARYYVYNLPALLDSKGEFYRDRAAGRLTIRTPQGDDASKHLIEAKKRDFGFDLSERSYITVKGVKLFACTLTTDATAGGDAVGYNADGSARYPWRPADWLAPSSHIIVDGIEAKYLNHFTDVSGHFFLQWPPCTGIVIAGSDHIIRNSNIQFAAGNGISLQGDRLKCINNLIQDTNYMSVDCAGISTGTMTLTTDTEIAYNTVLRTGRSGVTLRGLRNSDPNTFVSRMHHNDIAEYGLQDWDVGAFYMCGIDGTFMRIDHNFFHVSHAKATGMFHGAYWDFSKNYVLDHNIIWGVAKGIQVTHDFDHDKAKINNLIIFNNTVFNDGAAWGYPLAQGIGNGSVVQNNLLGINVFSDGTKNVNHWPVYGTGRVTVSKNLVYGWDPKGHYGMERLTPNDLYADAPGFVDAPKHDFRLTESSKAMKAGSRLGVISLEGYTVTPQYDTDSPTPSIGAIEDGKTLWKAGADLQHPMK